MDDVFCTSKCIAPTRRDLNPAVARACGFQPDATCPRRGWKRRSSSRPSTVRSPRRRRPALGSGSLKPCAVTFQRASATTHPSSPGISILPFSRAPDGVRRRLIAPRKKSEPGENNFAAGGVGAAGVCGVGVCLCVGSPCLFVFVSVRKLITPRISFGVAQRSSSQTPSVSNHLTIKLGEIRKHSEFGPFIIINVRPLRPACGPREKPDGEEMASRVSKVLIVHTHPVVTRYPSFTRAMAGSMATGLRKAGVDVRRVDLDEASKWTSPAMTQRVWLPKPHILRFSGTLLSAPNRGGTPDVL